MQRQQGFTLTETAVAIGVVAILSGIIIPLVLKNVRDAQVARARNDVQVIAAALASQLKDTGGRPCTAAGPGGATGTGQALWASPGGMPGIHGGAPLVLAGGNSLANLFTAPHAAATQAQANALFAIPGTGSEIGYQGPYLAADVAAKTDPWGSAYLILGYNAEGQRGNGPIWVVSAGPTRTIAAANVTPVNNQYPGEWQHGAPAPGNIAVRVN